MADDLRETGWVRQGGGGRVGEIGWGKLGGQAGSGGDAIQDVQCHSVKEKGWEYLGYRPSVLVTLLFYILV